MAPQLLWPCLPLTAVFASVSNFCWSRRVFSNDDEAAEAAAMTPMGQRSGQHADRQVGYRRRHSNSRSSIGPMMGALVASLALMGMLSGASASSGASTQNTARHVPVSSNTHAIRGRGRVSANDSMAQPSGINYDENDNDGNYPFDLLSFRRRGSRHLKEDNDKNAEPEPQPEPEPEAAAAAAPVEEEEDPDDDRVQACGLQWDRSISCGGKADKKDVVPVCCPGYVCEGEWCVLPKDEKTPEPTPAPTDSPTRMPTKMPTEVPTKAPTEAPTPLPTDPPVAVLPAVIPTPSPVTSSPTARPVMATASPTTMAPRPTPPPQPAIPANGILSVPLGSTTTYTYTFPRASYTEVTSLDSNLLAEVSTSFLYGRLLAVLDDKKSEYELIDGIDFTGVRMDVVDVQYENLLQDEDELREAGLLEDGENNKNNGKDNRNLAAEETQNGKRTKTKNRIGSSDIRRKVQQAPAFSIGRPKAIVTLSGEAKFRVTEPNLLVPAPGTTAEDNQFVLVDPTDVPGPSTLWDIQQLIWSEEGASDDFLELVKLAGDASRDVVGTVNFVKIEQDQLRVPTVPPTAMPTRRPTMAPVATVVVVEEEKNGIVFVPPTDGGMDSADGGGGEEEEANGGGFVPLEPEEPQETDEGSTFIPAAPETSGSTSKNTSNNPNDSTAGIVIGVVAALVVGLAILAFFLVKRRRRLDASAELVDKARAEKIQKENDLSPGQQTPPNGSTSVNEDGIEVGYAAGAAAASVAAGTAVASGSGSGSGGWLSSKFRPKYLSPGRATKNRPDPNGKRPTDDNSSLGSSSLGNGTTDSWAKRVQSNISVGGSTLRGADDGSLGDDFSVGAESIGGKAAGPAFTGDDVENVNMLGEIGMDDDVDVTRGYDMARTETAQSTWSFSGVGRKRQDPPITSPPNYGIAVAPQRSEVDNDDETEFAPDTRILNDDESALLEDDFDREFNRKNSDLTHISQGPGAIRPKQSASRYRGGNLATHNETGSVSVGFMYSWLYLISPLCLTSQIKFLISLYYLLLLYSLHSPHHRRHLHVPHRRSSHRPNSSQAACSSVVALRFARQQHRKISPRLLGPIPPERLPRMDSRDPWLVMPPMAMAAREIASMIGEWAGLVLCDRPRRPQEVLVAVELPQTSSEREWRQEERCKCRWNTMPPPAVLVRGMRVLGVAVVPTRDIAKSRSPIPTTPRQLNRLETTTERLSSRT